MGPADASGPSGAACRSRHAGLQPPPQRRDPRERLSRRSRRFPQRQPWRGSARTRSRVGRRGSGCVQSSMPQYSGGLGILAGDHLKAASDLGVPVVGVGLLYRHGYFVQSLSRDGWQQERYPLVDPNNLPVSLLRDADGSPVRIYVGLPGGRRLAAAVWVVQVGRVPLLMLDSDTEENGPAEREVTDRLYGGSSEHRLLQEMLLGIGGG